MSPRFPKLTPFGRLALLTASLLWLTAANYQNNPVFLTADLLFALLVVSGLWTVWQLRGIVVTPLPPEDGFAGSSVELFVFIHNPTPMGRVLQLRHPRAKRSQSLLLKPLERRSVVLELHFPKRGRFSLEPLGLASTFPLGLWQVERKIELAVSVWVYPKPARPLPSLQAQGGEGDGSELRGYRLGDPLNRIDWKRYSRTRHLYVKFTPKAASRKEMVLRLSDLEGDLERRLSVLCGWLLEAEKRGLSYRLELPSRAIDFGRGQDHLKRCLRLLAQCGPS